MFKTIVTAAIAFASTNVDDLFILMLFYSNRHIKKSLILPGQLLGIMTLVAISISLSFAKYAFDSRYIGIMGLFPIYLAIRQILTWRAHDTSDGNEKAATATSMIAIAGVTIANGGDNIGVYSPLISLLANIDIVLLSAVFVGMTILWCNLAKYLVLHPALARPLEKYSHYIMPLVLFLLGIFILLTADTFSLFKGLQ